MLQMTVLLIVLYFSKGTLKSQCIYIDKGV